MLLAIEARRTVKEVVAAMRVADVCGLCKQAFANAPGLCEECARTLDRWLAGYEGWPEAPPRRHNSHCNRLLRRNE